MRININQFEKARIGTIVGLFLEEKDKQPFVYGVKINNNQIVEVSPIYRTTGRTDNFTGGIRVIDSFIISRYKKLPDGIFKKYRGK